VFADEPPACLSGSPYIVGVPVEPRIVSNQNVLVGWAVSADFDQHLGLSGSDRTYKREDLVPVGYRPRYKAPIAAQSNHGIGAAAEANNGIERYRPVAHVESVVDIEGVDRHAE